MSHDTDKPFGRPPLDLDLDAIKRAASIGCTMDEIAAVLGIARSSLYLHAEKTPGVQEAIDVGRETGRTALRRMQWQKAEMGSDTMLIWLGKSLLGQKDRSDVTTDDKPVSGITVTFVKPAS